MKLQTHIPLQLENNPIDYSSKILLLGSCFAQNIAEKFKYFKFQYTSNPFGILYHPKAIEALIEKALIEKALNQKQYSESDIFFHNERWHCFDAHSDLSSLSKEELLGNLNNAVKKTNQHIHESTHIIITLGTAWSYRFLETDKVVANCHKVPQKQFKKELQSVKSIIQSLEHVVSLIQSINKDTSIIFTVSPVRHLKDGFVENTQSKSHLITAIHQIIKSNKSLFYFPSYEIMMDELRDYRFYAEDLVHPSQTAINYIWEKFKDVWVSESANATMQNVDIVQKGMKHKPFDPDSEQHETFLSKLEAQKLRLKSQFPHMEFS